MIPKMVLPLLTGIMCSGPGKIQLNLYGTIRPMPMNSRRITRRLPNCFPSLRKMKRNMPQNCLIFCADMKNRHLETV